LSDDSQDWRKDMLYPVIEFFKNAVVEKILQDPFWATVGLFGQMVFGFRFVLQWIVSEYKKKSYVPTSFWFISIIGSLILLVYSIHIKNPIFILGFSLNTLIYLRNLHLIYNDRAQKDIATIIAKDKD
jgi:lipid-A-disaccharide synthase-like uncharacterized protein